MSRPADTFRMDVGGALWFDETTDPNAGAGTIAPLGSVYTRPGVYPTLPREMYYKQLSSAKGWTKQNLVGLKVYNLTKPPYNVIADGATDQGPAVRQAVIDVAAAGGGILYFPAAPLPYAFGINAIGQNACIPVDNKQNLVFMGDGWSTCLQMTGNYNTRFQVLIEMTDRSQRIVIYNLRVSGAGIINPEVTHQDHLIQVSFDVPPALGTPHDIEIQKVWFDPIPGSGVRIFGQGAVGGGKCYDTRVRYCAFNEKNEGLQDARSCIEAQRNSSRIQVSNSWFAPSGAFQAGQQIDFEPGSGDAPDGWNITGNIFQGENEVSVTISSADATLPPFRNTFAWNIIRPVSTGSAGSTLECVNSPTKTIIVGNIVTMDPASTTGFAACELRNLTDSVVVDNIFISPNASATRPGMKIFEDSGQQPLRSVVADNLTQAVAAATAIAGIQLQATNEYVVSGNLVFVDCGTSTTSVGLQMRSTSFVGQDWVCNGNLVVATSAQKFTTGINITTLSGNIIHNVTVNNNLVQNTTNGITFDSTTAAFQDWRSCNNNLLPGSTNLTVAPPASNVGVTIDGIAGPQAQIDTIALAAGPNTKITAGPGSLCTNTSGVAASIIYIKESGTGNTGWFPTGAFEIVFGARQGSTTTTALFYAPGSDLATESATEIKVPMVRPGTIRNMRVICIAGTGGGNNTFTARKNGANTGLTVTFANTITSGTNIANTLPLVAGDLLSFQVTKTATPSTVQTAIEIAVECTG